MARVRSRLRLLLVPVLVATFVPFASATGADVDPDEIFFPVQVTDSLQYVDSYGDPRGGGRGHLGVDIMSDQMTPVFAAQPGTIFAYNDYCNDDGTYCSYYLLLAGDDDRMYFYVHLNDDTPGRPDGTCDHAGGLENAYAPRLFDAWEAGELEGLRVERGEHLGYLGSSGNAGCKVDHVHFEIWEGTDWSTHYSHSQNPYPPTRAAQDAGNVFGAEWPIEPDDTERIAGEDRIATAIELSKDGFESADTVVIAPSDVFAEALVGAPLAAVMEAPVLLTWPEDTDERDALDPRVADEITRLGATSVTIVGDPSRLSPRLGRQIVAATDVEAEQITRVRGETVAAMSVAVAKLVLAAQGVDVSADADDMTSEEPTASATASEESTASEAPTEDESAAIVPFLAAGTHPDGKGWPDALAASVLGSRQLAPILLTDAEELSPELVELLELDAVTQVRITGGPVAVSEAVEVAVLELGVETRRLAGETRYETALAIAAETLEDGAALDTVAIATGVNFPDALAAGPVLGRSDRPLVLVHTDDEVASVTDFFRTNADEVELVQAIGGPVAISDANLRRTAVSAAHRYE